jgi:hypothetical protein
MLGDFMLLIAFVDNEGCYHTCSVLQAVVEESAGFSVGKQGGWVTKFVHKNGFRSCFSVGKQGG